MAGSTLIVLICFLAIGAFANCDDSIPQRRSIVATVDCYNCVSCDKTDRHTDVKTCPYNPDPLRVKKCVKFEEKLANTATGVDKSWVVRACASDRGTCEEIKSAYASNPDVTLDYCVECEGDRCNSASRSVSELFLAFLTVIVVPIFVKFTLS